MSSANRLALGARTGTDWRPGVPILRSPRGQLLGEENQAVAHGPGSGPDPCWCSVFRPMRSAFEIFFRRRTLRDSLNIAGTVRWRPLRLIQSVPPVKQGNELFVIGKNPKDD